MGKISDDLLKAAIEYRDNSDAHIGSTGKPLDDAIAAAEREADERQQPIDEAWLRSIGCKLIDGDWFLKHQRIVFSDGCWYAIRLGPLVIIASRGQLLDLLSGLGIEVKQ